MTMTELATVEDEFDGEIVDEEEYPELTPRAAKALDKKIRACSDKVAFNTNALLDLLAEASQGQIHIGLGLPSWTAYVKDAVQIQITDRIERKELVGLLSGKGLSQRTIGNMLGISQKTVDRDLDGQEFDDDGTIETVTGAKRARTTKKQEAEEDSDDEVVDAEVVEDETPEPKRQSVGQDFKDELYQLENDVEALNEVLEDERFEKSRKRIDKAYGEKLDDLINALHTIRATVAQDGE